MGTEGLRHSIPPPPSRSYTNLLGRVGSLILAQKVSSLDGFIAKKDESISWLQSSDSYEKGVTEESTEEFLKTLDCFVIGSRTYELALTLGWPCGDVPTIPAAPWSLWG